MLGKIPNYEVNNPIPHTNVDTSNKCLHQHDAGCTDGKIYVSKVETAVRIATGERGDHAV